jgi:sarcosine oxidase subunit gamma
LGLIAFPIGMCTRTLFGKAEIVLWRTGEAQFHIEVWRSFAGYVWGGLRATHSAPAGADPS